MTSIFFSLHIWQHDRVAVSIYTRYTAQLTTLSIIQFVSRNVWKLMCHHRMNSRIQWTQPLAYNTQTRHCSHFLCIYANKAIWNTDQIEPYIWFVRKVNWIKFLRVGISRMKYVYNWIFHLSLKRPHAKCTREWNCYIWTIFSSVIPCTGTVSARRQVS